MCNLKVPDQKQTYQHRMANRLHTSCTVCIQGVFLGDKDSHSIKMYRLVTSDNILHEVISPCCLYTFTVS